MIRREVLLSMIENNPELRYGHDRKPPKVDGEGCAR